MSWLARSIANTLNLDDDKNNNSPNEGGIKQDLSDLTQTLTQGITSFISPGPSDGIRRDFAEIGGKFRTSISNLSNNLHVADFTKLASHLLHLDSDSDSDGDDVVGVTDEVVVFVKDVVMHPQTWLDFPLPHNENEDFKLSDVQQEHVLAVERLVPGLSALRIELCPGYMSESSFWKIYFVLLHPRLERHAAELLSTHEILKVRATLTHELKNRPYALSNEEPPGSNLSSGNLPDSVPLEVSAMETCTPAVSTDTGTVKHPSHSDEIPIVDKSQIQEEPHDTAKAEDDTDDWLKEESSEIVSSRVTIPIGNDEDVSFSDFEDDDDDGNIPIHYKKATYTSDSSIKESQGWVQLGRSSTDSGKDSDFSTIDVA
ncbi:BSD-like protein [Artemisia annua]|uniref:BSD-like protein n=1 Tax=Artemisia annua TaxID=35608 RepID=A0A2U1NR72_ARTAN|nr:BSD-like protein [Artemisia annua]